MGGFKYPLLLDESRVHRSPARRATSDERAEPKSCTVFVRIYVRIFVRIYVWVFVRIFVRIYVRIFVWIYVRLCTRAG